MAISIHFAAISGLPCALYCVQDDVRFLSDELMFFWRLLQDLKAVLSRSEFNPKVIYHDIDIKNDYVLFAYVSDYSMLRAN